MFGRKKSKGLSESDEDIIGKIERIEYFVVPDTASSVNCLLSLEDKDAIFLAEGLNIFDEEDRPFLIMKKGDKIRFTLNDKNIISNLKSIDYCYY